MVRPEDVAVSIYAAGKSSRMGKFKPLLPIGEYTLIEQVIKNTRVASIQLILVKGKSSFDFYQIKARV